MKIFVETMKTGGKNHGMNGSRNDGFFGRFQQLGNSGDEFFVIAKYRIACSHVCGGVFARNGFWGTVGKRVAGNPSVDFFQKILIEWMLRVLKAEKSTSLYLMYSSLSILLIIRV